MKTLIELFGFLLVGYVSVGAALFMAQRNFIYFPTEPVEHGEDVIGFEHEGATLDVIRLNSGHASALLYFGGNAEEVAYNAPEFGRAFPEHTVYLVNYRGYGGSTGKPSEAALFADAVHVHDQLAGTHDTISVVGRSLGSGVATFLAANREVDKLVLVTPFDSILRVAQARFPIFPLSVLLMDQFDSASRAHQVTADVLIVIAENDEIISARAELQLD